MANIASNPWSLTSTDVNSGTLISCSLNSDGTVSISVGVALNNINPGDFVTLFGNTPGAFNGFYQVSPASNGNHLGFVLIPVPTFSVPAGTVNTVLGGVAKCLYNAQIRVEDISWQSAAVAGDLLDLRDRMGNIIWQCKASGANQQNRGKVFWVNGLSPVAITSGLVIITVD